MTGETEKDLWRVDGGMESVVVGWTYRLDMASGFLSDMHR